MVIWGLGTDETALESGQKIVLENDHMLDGVDPSPFHSSGRVFCILYMKQVQIQFASFH